jgi:hypothetical protein
MKPVPPVSRIIGTDYNWLQSAGLKKVDHRKRIFL